METMAAERGPSGRGLAEARAPSSRSGTSSPVWLFSVSRAAPTIRARDLQRFAKRSRFNHTTLNFAWE